MSMFSETQYKEYITFKHQLSDAAKEYISDARNQEASRMVGTHAGTNACSFVPSSDMSHTVSVESRGPEGAFKSLCQYDERIPEIWDQPPAIKIRRHDKNGKKRSEWYSPDFLILPLDGPAIIEVKDLSTVTKLCEKYPDDWIKNDDGEFEYLPAKKAFAEIGLVHKVFVYKKEMRFKINNIDLILKNRKNQSVQAIDEKKIDKAFESSFSWTLYDLKEYLNLDNYRILISLIDNGKLFIDIDQHLISEPKGCITVRNLDLLCDAVSLSDRNKLFDPVKVKGVDARKFPPEKDAKKVLHKLERIKNGENSRSIRRWKADIINGAKKGLTPFQSLIPKTYLSGNRKKRIPPKVDAFLDKFLIEKYAPQQGLSMYRGYIQYRVEAKEQLPSYPPVVRETFRKRLKSIPAETIEYIRNGKRAGNAAQEPSDPAERLLKSDLPWRSAAIDHYLADIFLIFYSDDGVVHVIRPWVTAMIDLCTGVVLAFSVSFQNPSRRSVCKVIRECVRKYGKLPAEIIVDRGSDFRSVYFASLLAHYEVTLTLRPSSHSRYGGEVEGLFGEFKKQWLTQRQGNLTDFKEARSVDGKKMPKKTAIFQPFDFYREFSAFCEWRDHKPRGIRNQSGFDAFHKGEADFPFISIDVEFNDEFLLATAVDTSNYKIDLQRGIHIGDQYFWSPKLGDLRGKKTRTDVRDDPENPHIVYAKVDQLWVSCLSSSANRFSALDPVSQHCEMLTVYEARNAKNQVRMRADEDLYRKVREMDKLAQSNVVPIVEVDGVADDLEDDVSSIFSKIANSSLTELSVENW